MTPFDHQIAARDFLLAGGTLLAHDAGTGKTFSTILACEADPLGGTTLIGCPAVALGVWEREIELIAPHRSALILTSKTIKRLDEQDWDYIIVSIDLAARSAPVFRALKRSYNRVVVDECHNLKSGLAARTIRWLTMPNSIISWAEEGRRWLLSGTPTPNHAGDLWALIRGTRPEILGDESEYQDFENRFCRHKLARRGGFDERVVAGTNLVRVKELRRRLDGWWQRVKKSDVLDLPDRSFRVIPIDIGKLNADVARLQESAEGMAVARAIRANTGAMANLEDDQSMSRFRELLSEAKAPAVAAYVKGIIDGGTEAVLVWFWHTSGMKVCEATLRKAGITTCKIDGSTPNSQRRIVEERFQRADGPQVFLGQIKAAGTAITLTRATHAVFGEASWNPAENLQAADRCYRIGTKENVICDFLAVRDTLDMAVLTTCERKTRETTELEKRP